MRDRKLLNDTLTSAYRMQARGDYMAKKRTAARTAKTPDAPPPVATPTPVAPKPRGLAVGTKVELQALAIGQRFECIMPNHKGGVSHTVKGHLIYATQGRARVQVDAIPVTRSFTNSRTGEQVELTGGQWKELDWAPDTEVTVLEGFKDFALQNTKSVVKSKHAQIERGGIMAKDKKAAKKTNGEAKPSKRAEFTAKTIKVLAAENPKRKGSESAKRFAYYKDGMTVGAFVEKGGTLGDVHYDTTHGHIKVS